MDNSLSLAARFSALTKFKQTIQDQHEVPEKTLAYQHYSYDRLMAMLQEFTDEYPKVPIDQILCDIFNNPLPGKNKDPEPIESTVERMLDVVTIHQRIVTLKEFKRTIQGRYDKTFLWSAPECTPSYQSFSYSYLLGEMQKMDQEYPNGTIDDGLCNIVNNPLPGEAVPRPIENVIDRMLEFLTTK